ncbi:CLUMA_CG002135, isoform A [Clunio marinus]|uniref:CLUMA_CG002135, isoform A n=1 Tax=Clunio marinus TaxID=568069 RepID=A0A1J1HPF6_9DIPT|nr:CLUMA_CG002135, isoform A [Clunio marinus]
MNILWKSEGDASLRNLLMLIKKFSEKERKIVNDLDYKILLYVKWFYITIKRAVALEDLTAAHERTTHTKAAVDVLGILHLRTRISFLTNDRTLTVETFEFKAMFYE